MDTHSWIYQPSLEKMPRRDLEELQLKRLRWTVRRAYEKVPVYRRLMREAGVGPDDVRSLEDVSKLPFTRKSHLRDAYPYGMLAAPLEEIVEIHASSGTTGKPTLVAYTARDLENWGELMARTLASAGLRKGDVLHISLNYHMFTGGLGFHYGAQRLGASVVPAGPGYSERQVRMIVDFGATMLTSVPNYALRLAEVAWEMGVDPARDTKVRKGAFGAEAWSDALKKKIEEAWDMESFDVYGMSELYGPGVAVECGAHEGLHVWEDHYLVEVVDPETGEPLEPEEEGVLVVTPLTHDAMPLIRYWTGDLTRILDTRGCDCGRTHRRIARIKGRSDDMVVVNGVNLYPSAVEEVALSEPWAGNNYLIEIDKRGVMDRARLVIESARILSEEEKKAYAARLREKIRSLLIVSMDIEIVDPGTLERTSGGKARRLRVLG